MSEFDPQAYLDANASSTPAFDPQAYLKANEQKLPETIAFDPKVYVASEGSSLTEEEFTQDKSKGSWHVDGESQLWVNPEGKAVQREEVPKEIMDAHQDQLKSTDGGNTFLTFFYQNKEEGVEGNFVRENIAKFKPTVDERQSIEDNVSNLIDKYRKDKLTLDTQVEEVNKTKSSNLIQESGPVMMLDPVTGMNIPMANEQSNQKAREAKEISQRLYQDRNTVEKDLKESRVGDFVKQAQDLINKDIENGLMSAEDNTEENLYAVVNTLMTKKDLTEAFNRNVEQYIEDNQGILQLTKPEWQKKEFEKSQQEYAKLETKQAANIEKMNFAYNEIVSIDKKISNFYTDYEKRLQPYLDQGESFNKEYEEKNLSSVNENSSQEEIDVYNEWRIRKNEWINSYNTFLDNNKKDIEIIKQLQDDRDNHAKVYQFGVEYDLQISKDAEDLVAYTNIMNRNGHNITAATAWVGSSAVSIINGLEGEFNKWKELPEDLLYNYYDNDITKMPDIVAALKARDNFTDAMRFAEKERVNKFITDLNASVQRPTQYEDIKNVSDLGNFGLHAVANFLPQIGIMAATGPSSIYILGASASGNKYDEMERSNKLGNTNYSLSEKWLASTIVGAGEVLSEKVTFDIFKGLPKPTLSRIKGGFVNEFYNAFQNISMKGTLKAGNTMFMESGSEGLAEITNNFADRYVLNDKSVNLFDNVEGAMLTGLFMERTMAMPAIYSKMSNMLTGKDYQTKMVDYNNRQKDLEDIIADKNVGSVARENAENKWLKIQAQKEEILAKNIENVDLMSQKDKDNLIKIDNDIHALKLNEDAINADNTLTEKQKETLIAQNRVEEADALKQKQSILSSYESDETRAKKKERFEKQRETIQAKVDKINKLRPQSEQIEFVVDNSQNIEELMLADQALYREEIQFQQEIINDPNATAREKYIAKRDRDIAKQALEGSKAAGSQFGFIQRDGSINGAARIVINEETALDAGGNINVAAHEFLHQALFQTIKGDMRIQDNLGNALLDHVSTLKANKVEGFNKKLAQYGTFDEQGNFIKDSNFGEEVITLMSESIMDGTLEFNEGFFTKAGDLIRQNLQRLGIRKIKFNTGRDVYNFIKDYNASIEKGYDSIAIDRLMDQGAKGKLVDSVIKVDLKTQYSKSGFEQNQIIEDLNLKDKTADIVAKNKDIEAKILEQGLKDSNGNIMASPALQQALVRNNLPRAFALARDAAGKANSLTLEEALKQNDVMEWYSEYSLKLTELARTYRAEKDGKKVPFGAYMNTLLPKKYSGILEKLKSKIETARIEDEAVARKVAKKITPKPKDDSQKEIEGKAIALETIGHGDIMPKLRKTYNLNRRKVKRQETYKDVKSAIIKAKQEGPYFQALIDVAEIFTEGVYEGEQIKIDVNELVKRIRIKQDLTQPMRKVIQDKIIKHAPEMINMIPGGTSASGDATGIANTNLGKAWFIKKGKTKFADTGSRKGLPIQDKKSLSLSEFLAPFGLGEKGKRVSKRDVDGALREWIMQVATLAMNQASRQADPKNVPLKKTKEGKNPFQFSKKGEVIFGGIKSLLTEQQGQVFEENLPQFVSNFVGINEAKMDDKQKEQVLLSEDIEAIEIALDEVYGDTFSKQVKNKIAKEIARQVGKLNLKPKSKRIVKVQKIVDQIIKSTEASQVKVAKFTGSNITAAKAQDELVRQETRRKADGVYFKRQFNKNKEQAIADLVLIAGHSATSGKIGKGRGQYYEGVKDFYDTNLGKVGITPVYDTFKRGNTIVYTLNVEKTAKANNLKEIPITKASQSTSGAMLDHTEALNGDTTRLDARRKHENHARRVLNDYIAFNVEQYNKGLQDNIDIMLMMTSLLSNMNSVLARAGGLNLVQPGVTAKNGRYEHGHPRVAVLLRLMNEHLNKNGVKNLNAFFKNYDVNIIDTNFDDAITDAGYKETLADGQTFEDPSYDRMYNEKTFGDKRVQLLVEAGTNNTPQKIQDFVNGSIQFSKVPEFANFNKNNTIQKAINFSKNTRNPVKGITVLDFDDTLATTKSLVKFTKPDGTTGTLNAEQYAKNYEDLLDKGYTFDFSDFNKVVEGKIAPLFQKALKLQNKFGSENMFVLTARPQASAQAIYDFLTANGLNIPLQNITGLANSTAEAKALWIADKVADGYNDFYFADDALQNVQAVKNMLDQFDVKSKVQQAKIQFSKNISDEINSIIEQNTGVKKEARFSSAEARARGIGKGKYKIWIPPGAEDFMGLMYTIASARGRKGEQQLEFIRKSLLEPYNNGISALNEAKQEISGNYKQLLKQNPEIKKLLNKDIEGTSFSNEQAIRVYLWDKAGFEIPGIAAATKKKLIQAVENNSQMKGFADSLGKITKMPEGYVEPNIDWVAEGIVADLNTITDEIGRSQFLQEFVNNANEAFSEENLNKLESIYGRDYRDALENALYRMKSGRNKTAGTTDAQVNKWTKWIRNSVGAIMFVNTRSALLQTISAVNFINWSDNNPIRAAAAFANQKQYWKDFTMIFNSPYLKQRRSGLKTDVNEARLAQAIAGKKNKASAALAYLLKMGFLPTQIADSFAIAAGGATFYRNRVKSLMKQGMSQQQAEEQAFQDLQDVANVSQQSSDAALTSRQQNSILGAFVLAFQNTPMQYARLTKKAAIDLIKGRGDWKTNVSKIVYYTAIQNLIFNAMQQALFALMFTDDEDDEKELQRQIRLGNGMLDSVLRGTGIYGAVAATAKNIALEFYKQDLKGSRADHAYTILQFANISPPIGSKLRKLYSATQTRKFNRRAMEQMGYDIYNPAVPAIATAIEAFTNLPTGRIYKKFSNVSEAFNEENENWQRIALMMGWNTWDLGIKESFKVKYGKPKRSKTRSRLGGKKSRSRLAK